MQSAIQLRVLCLESHETESTCWKAASFSGDSGGESASKLAPVDGYIQAFAARGKRALLDC